MADFYKNLGVRLAETRAALILRAQKLKKIIMLLWVKIIGTLVGAALPMLFLSYPLFRWLGFPEQDSMLFLRLYGLSTSALLVGYYGGIEMARRGEFPIGVLRMGLVSNGGQGLALVIAGMMGVYDHWGWMAQAMMWSLGAFILMIAAAILLALKRGAPAS